MKRTPGCHFMVLKLYSGVTESPEKIVQYSLKIRGMFVFGTKHKFRLNGADYRNRGLHILWGCFFLCRSEGPRIMLILRLEK